MKRKTCPSCGAKYSKGGPVYMMIDGALQRRAVCARCLRASVRILIEPPLALVQRSKTLLRGALADRAPNPSPLMDHIRGD